MNDEIIKGTFYEKELSKTKNTTGIYNRKNIKNKR